MSRNAIMGGVPPKGLRRIQFDFEIDGVHFRPTLPWTPMPANLEQAQKLNARIKAQIEAGTFVFSDVFPKLRELMTRDIPIEISDLLYTKGGERPVDPAIPARETLTARRQRYNC
jgi:hypothetical protein